MKKQKCLGPSSESAIHLFITLYIVIIVKPCNLELLEVLWQIQSSHYLVDQSENSHQHKIHLHNFYLHAS